MCSNACSVSFYRKWRSNHHQGKYKEMWNRCKYIVFYLFPMSTYFHEFLAKSICMLLSFVACLVCDPFYIHISAAILGVGYTGQKNRFRWHKVFWMCLGITRKKKKNFFEKSANFRVCSPKPFGQNGHFGPYIPISHPQYSKSI